MSHRPHTVSTHGKLRSNPHTTEPNINSAIQKGYFQQIRFLIELGYSVNETDHHGRTPLINCALIEDESWGVGLARLFLEKGATLRPRDKHGLNAMHYACIYERIGLAESYLKASDFNLNQQDRLGNTSLHYTVTSGNLTITQMIINNLLRYRQTVDIKNVRGVTPLLQAWKSGHLECARMLVELGNAAQDIYDPQVNKCARDYEIDLLAKVNSMSQETAESISTTDSFGPRLPRYMTSVSEKKKRVYQRAQSAPPGGRSDKASNKKNCSENTKFGITFPFNECKLSSAKSIIGKEDISTKFYRDAGHFNPRNIPEFVFKSSPTQCFTSDHTISYHNSAPCPSECSSAALAVGNHPSIGWKSEVKTLLNSYDFQWTDSYRKSIIPYSTTLPLTGEQDEIYQLRPTSPTSEGDAMSRRPNRRYTGLKHLQSALGGFGEGLSKGAHNSRRPSIISTSGKSSQRGSFSSLTSLLPSDPASATSSEGSIKKKSKQKHKPLLIALNSFT